MCRLLDSVCAVLYYALLIDQLQRGCEALVDCFATCSQKAADKAHSSVTLLRRLAVYLKMAWLFWLPLLQTASTAAVRWGRWGFQAIRAGLGQIWSAGSALAAFHISECCLKYLRDRLSLFERLVQSCFHEATAWVKHTLAYAMRNAMRKFKALVWLSTVSPFVLLAKVGRLLLFCPPGCFLLV